MTTLLATTFLKFVDTKEVPILLALANNDNKKVAVCKMGSESAKC